MKVLHINHSDINGGAARAAYRIHKGMLDHGVASKMLVSAKSSNDNSVLAPRTNIKKLYNIVIPGLTKYILGFQKTPNPVYHSINVAPSGLPRLINNMDIDLVHFHWIGGETISIREVAKINKPIVWTLHDMWAFSGAEHYDDLTTPGRYIGGYSNNRSPDHRGIDIDRWTWLRKKKYWSELPLHFITPSHWLESCTKQSKLFNVSKHSVQTIHNGINQDVYKPNNSDFAREVLNLPKTKKLILFGAMNSTSDTRKGYYALIEALKLIEKSSSKDIEVVIFGASSSEENTPYSLPCHFLGELKDDVSLSLLYSAADVFVAPSQQDNLPNTLVESLSCGTPCVAFEIGGMPDLIDHKENGYLAKPYLSKDLAEGIQWTLNNIEHNNLRDNSRLKAQKYFDIENVSEQYIAFYETVLSKLQPYEAHQAQCDNSQ